jgi:hypothetical protein
MTLVEAIRTVLRQAGLTPSESGEQDVARDYINMAIAEIAALARWWWLDRTTTFATVASTRVYTPISEEVASWESFVDETNSRTLEILGADTYDEVDLDRSESGNVRAVFLGGMDATTGLATVECWPTPSAVATVRIRYSRMIPAFTSSDDATTLLALGVPRVVTNAIIHRATELKLAEEGENRDSQYAARYNESLQLALQQNVRQRGNRKYLPIRYRSNAPLIRVGTDLVET